MKLSHRSASSKPTRVEMLAVLGTQKKKPVLPTGVKIAASAVKDFSGNFRATRLTDATGGFATRVLLVGLGQTSEQNVERLRRAAAIAVSRAEAIGVTSLRIEANKELVSRLGGEEVGCALAEGAVMGHYRYDAGKSKPKPRKLKSVHVAGDAAVRRGVTRGNALAAANLFTRELQNAPGNRMTPTELAKQARKVAGMSPRIRCTVLDERKMKELGMGLLLGVSRGSVEPAKFIHLVYKPKVKAKSKVALVGKGLTFDAGGISIKPSGKMDEMRYDMSGGAAVVGCFRALADIDVPHEVHGIVPASENLCDAAATKPGDVHRCMDGTTVEILNTDAEGRLILADALAYTRKKVQPDTIIDLATLTGAVIVALGHEVSGMFTASDKLRKTLTEAGEDVGERVWPLPLFPIHKERMKGTNADLRNIGPGDMGAGSTQGAAFLSHFVGDTEWCHLDIAGSAWGTAARDWVGGPLGSGVGARLLLRYLERR